MSISIDHSQSSVMEQFHSPNRFIRRFVAKRSRRSSLILGVILGLYMLSKASSYISTYPSELARQKLAESLGSNVGIEALLGIGHHIDTVSGFANWNFLCLIAAVGAIWAFFLATKTLRGEEDSGRWELLLSGQTTARKATTQALAGLGGGLIILYLFVALSVLSIGKLHGANFTTSESLFFALALIAGAVEFLAVGALASQLMPVRSRAIGLSAGVFGLFYLIRMVADTTSAHWLLNISPLGWIEKLQPMTNSQPLWLLPIGIFVLILSVFAILLAGRRDLGSATFADKDIVKARYFLLRSPFTAAIRLNRSLNFGWLMGIGLSSFLYGLLANGAAKSFSQSTSIKRGLNRLAPQASSLITAKEFMGIIFFLIMVLLMFFAISGIGRIRNDEAQGYLDNFLVRPVGRLKWLWGRIVLVVTVIVIGGLLSSATTWLGETSQHTGIAFNSLLLAGSNAVIPGLFIVGIGTFIFGILPRYTNAISYAAIGWSFLVFMLSSGLNLNHWLLDTSILHQVVLAPAVNPDWHINIVVLILTLVLCLIGSVVFNQRDLQNE